MSLETSPEQIRGNASGSESYALFVFFCVAFIVLLMLVVSIWGGNSLCSRLQRWDWFRISIQSTDAARQALDDANADTDILEGFLLPSPESHDLARAFYDKWRSTKDWSLSVEGTKWSEGLDKALVTRTLKMTRDNQVRMYLERAVWEKHSGTWYLKDSKEDLKEEHEMPSREVTLP